MIRNFFIFFVCAYNLSLYPHDEYVIGATVGKTEVVIGLFQITNNQPILLESVAKSMADVKDFNDHMRYVCSELLKKHKASVARACLGVSGNPNPARDFIQSPHLSFPIDAKQVAHACGFHYVTMINDFEGISYGIKGVGPDGLITIHKGAPRDSSAKIVIGAGNGLGSSLIVPDSATCHARVMPLEAAFTSFAPVTKQELDFADFVRNKIGKNGNVSWGYVLGSKGGIMAVYEFLHHKNPFKESQEIFDNHLTNGKCKKAVDFYMTLYIRLLRNSAFFTQSYGGLYITNKVALNNPELFKDPAFLAQMFDCHNDILNAAIVQIPIYLVTDPKVGLYGTAYFLLQEGKAK
jgi:glucokinase